MIFIRLFHVLDAKIPRFAANSNSYSAKMHTFPIKNRFFTTNKQERREWACATNEINLK
jgi:hypothetical protein